MVGNVAPHIPQQPNTRTRNPQARFVVKPKPPVANLPDAGFIKSTANNFAHPKAKGYRSQDVAHSAIFRWLVTHTYNPLKVLDTDPYKPAYQAILTGLSGKTPNPLAIPLVLVTPQRGIPAPYPARFVGDFMQIQADNVTMSGWRDANAINDLAINSNFGKDFTAIVDEINKRIAIIAPTFQLQVFPFYRVAHRDAIQIVPDVRKGIPQFAGAISNGVTITNNHITSTGEQQGIFASDGAFRNLTIARNSVSTQGQYAITITGVLSGTINGNTTPTNKPVTLLPLRIGGGDELNGNIYILGFSAIPTGQQANVDTVVNNKKVYNYWYENMKWETGSVAQAGLNDYRRNIYETVNGVLLTS
ncbi:right-handed parallel beta-helix repeat-containing protein [Thiofilum flexile]|uniref:right-handed parallel beta-helix repeat-containing protein n=1 Tax=Thiofilum flexile TaxID=125627 RepID=UPI000364D455|nr:right-handed parallel beta-helix repeat-containing protein [Thiofilum flexile]